MEAAGSDGGKDGLFESGGQVCHAEELVVSCSMMRCAMQAMVGCVLACLGVSYQHDKAARCKWATVTVWACWGHGGGGGCMPCGVTGV
jgi:hypothetical protein